MLDISIRNKYNEKVNLDVATWYKDVNDKNAYAIVNDTKEVAISSDKTTQKFREGLHLFYLSSTLTWLVIFM